MVRKKTTTDTAESEPLLEKGSTRKRFSNAGDVDHATKRQRPELEGRTDYSRWRMRDDHSRHTWQYLEDDDAAKAWPQTYADKYFLGLPLVSPSGCNYSGLPQLSLTLPPPGPPGPSEAQEPPRLSQQRP